MFHTWSDSWNHISFFLLIFARSWTVGYITFTKLTRQLGKHLSESNFNVWCVCFDALLIAINWYIYWYLSPTLKGQCIPSSTQAWFEPTNTVSWENAACLWDALHHSWQWFTLYISTMAVQGQAFILEYLECQSNLAYLSWMQTGRTKTRKLLHAHWNTTIGSGMLFLCIMSMNGMKLYIPCIPSLPFVVNVDVAQWKSPWTRTKSLKIAVQKIWKCLISTFWYDLGISQLSHRNKDLIY